MCVCVVFCSFHEIVVHVCLHTGSGFVGEGGGGLEGELGSGLEGGD